MADADLVFSGRRFGEELGEGFCGPRTSPSGPLSEAERGRKIPGLLSEAERRKILLVLSPFRGGAGEGFCVTRLPNADGDDRLDAVIAEYLESVERGEPATAHDWVERYPDLATELELFFAAETRFDRLIAPLRSAPVSSNSVSTPASSSEQPLRTVKDYDLLAEIGRGGMGVIYKARQRSLNRLVAIKMIRSAEWATPAERFRFRWEAEAVAALDHPNIVPIYEIGEVVSDDGTQLPFFSMKLIEGHNLAQARDRFHNEWKACAGLVIIVARVVEHAHQRGILHRDLKPANILLGNPSESGDNGKLTSSSGVALAPSRVMPYVSDFGLAARAQQRGQTLAGTIVGTPSYLAPELAGGEAAATIASDVYALGAILYELLTGAPPFRAETPLETIRLLTTTPVKAPRKLNPAIPVDLETICLKCLQPDVQKRYRSAGKLAEDLELFLAGRSISARPMGTFEAFRRWCRRQPVIAGLAGALLLSVAISLPLILLNWRRAVDQERLAETRLEEAKTERERADGGFELAHGAFDDLFRMIGDRRMEESPGSEALNKDLLERGLRYYREFVDRRRDDPKMRRELAAAMFRIGLITSRIGTNRETADAYDKAIVFLRSTLEQYPNDLTLLNLLGSSLTNYGHALGHLNRLDEAFRSYEEAAELYKNLPELGGEKLVADRKQATAWMHRGLAALGMQQDWNEALSSAKRSKSILTAQPVPPQELSPLITCLLNIAAAEDHLNHPDEALRSVHEAQETAERMLAAAPNSLQAAFYVGESLRLSGKLETRKGNFPLAKKCLESAQQRLEGLRRLKPRVAEYQRTVALVYDDLAALAEREKKPAEAMLYLERALPLFRALLEKDAEAHADRAALAESTSRYGQACYDTKNFELACTSFEEARGHIRYLLDQPFPNPELRSKLAHNCFKLGLCLSRLKKFKEALAATDESIEQRRNILERTPADGANRKNLSSALGNRAIYLRQLSRPAEALRATENRVHLWSDNPGELYDAAGDFVRTYGSVPEAGDGNQELRNSAVKLAVQALRQALAAGFAEREKIANDPLFSKIRETNEFRMFLKEHMLK